MPFKVRRDPLDKLFSDYIRLRDKLTCQKCGKEYAKLCRALHCAHYHKRRKKSVRFDPDNAVTFCYGCHQYADENRDEFFTPFMIRRLGQEGFDFLAGRMRQLGAPDRKLIKLWLTEELKKLG